MAQIVWTEPALADLDAIADYIAIESPVAAAALVQRVLQRVEQLACHPDSGPRVPELPDGRYRQLIEPPCRIVYRHDAMAETVHVLHAVRTERLLRGVLTATAVG